MDTVDTVESLLGIAPHGKNISDHPGSQIHWRGQKSIFAYDTSNEDIINSIRIMGERLYAVEADGEPQRLRQLSSTGIDTGDQRIYVAPTAHRNSKLTYASCRTKFLKTFEANSNVRVGVVYSETNGIEGVDLGWYKVIGYSGSKSGSFLILEPNEELDFAAYPDVDRVGIPMVVGNTVTNSQHEGRFQVFLQSLGIPYMDEHQLPVYTLSTGGKYAIDYKIYPNDPHREAFVELKQTRPTHTEIMKAGELHRMTGIPVFLVWGDTFTPGLGVDADKWDPSGRSMKRGDYNDGIRASRVFTNEDGEIDYAGEFYFMANDKAKGETWERVMEEEDESSVDLYTNKGLSNLIHRKNKNGRVTIGTVRRMTMFPRPTITKRTRVVTLDGARYRPTDTFKPYLFRYNPFRVHKPSTYADPGPSDWNSDIMKHAYQSARDIK